MSSERHTSPAATEPFAAGENMRLPDAVQQLLAERAWRKTLQPGDALFLRGSEPDALFGVIAGELRVSTVEAGGREAVIAVLTPGHWFGEVSLLVGRERVYEVAAVRPTDVAVVEAADFHALISARPDVLMAFTRLVCIRLRQALAWIDDAILMPLPARLARRLVSLCEGGRSVSVSQDDLAAMLGISRQGVNRQLKLWEAEGLVSLEYRGIEVIEPARLKALAAP